MKSYVKDTADFISKIESQPPVPAQSLLVSMDVKSLYTYIPHKEGFESIRTSLEVLPSTSPTIVILKLLELILTLNNFVFNIHSYRQIKGCAMGTKCAPCYANLFMGEFETRYMYRKIENFSLLYLSYVDDIFMVWNGTKYLLEHFIKELNVIHPTIKFDYQINVTEINFLDTTVFKDALHSKSEHPPVLKKSIPYSQALRVRKICYNDKDFKENCSQLAETFHSRGYNRKFIDEQIGQVFTAPRRNLLRDRRREPLNRIPMITTFNRPLPPLSKIINKNWNILQLDRNIIYRN